MARVSPTEYAEKWGRRMKGATPDIQNGIKKVTTAPGVKAAAQSGVMLANLTQSVNSGVWAKQVGRVSLGDWQAAALNKGVQRIAAGVDGAATKVAGMAGKLLSAVDGAVAVVEQTPRGDLETNIGRATTFMREMSARAPKKQG